MLVRLGLLFLCMLTLTGCPGSLLALSRMNSTEIQSAKSNDLCEAYALGKRMGEKHSNIEGEIERRGLNCSAAVNKQARYANEHEAKYGAVGGMENVPDSELCSAYAHNRRVNNYVKRVDAEVEKRGLACMVDGKTIPQKRNESGNIPREFLTEPPPPPTNTKQGISLTKNISWTEAELARFAKEPFRKKKGYPIGESPWDKIKNKNPLKEYSRAGYWKGLDEQYRKGYLAYNAAASTDHGIDRYFWEQEINPPNSAFCGTPSRIKTLKDLKAEEVSRKGSICEGVPLRIRKSDEQVNKEWEEYVTSDEYMAKRMSDWDRQDEMAGALLFIGLALFLHDAPMIKAGGAPELIAPRFIRSIPKGLSGKMEGLTVLDTELKNIITTVAPKGTLKNIEGLTFKRLRLLEETGVKNTTKTIVVY